MVVTPLRRKLSKLGWSEDTLVEMLARRGRRASPRYLAMIIDGYYPPGRKLAQILSEVTGVSFESIALYPYRAQRA